MRNQEWTWRVVLVRPRNPLNIGAAARAMANFGLSDLTLVEPYPPVWDEARSAVGAEEVVRQARAVGSLIEAVGDTTVVLGTTCGSRRNLDRALIPLPELPGWLRRRAPRRRGSASAGRVDSRAERKVALLFGSEKTGLSNESMGYCHGLVRVPTALNCPAMNLGQAVAVCCYELARAGAVARIETPLRTHLSDPANLQSLEHILARAAWVLDEVGYLKPKSRVATLLKLRRLIMDSELTNSDAKILGGVLAQIEWKLRLADRRL